MCPRPCRKIRQGRPAETASELDALIAQIAEDDDDVPEVDLLIPTYNEPLSVVRYTALAARNIDWPPKKLHIFLLDDGKREDFRAFAEAANVGYMTRNDNQGAKAGNINRALGQTHSPYVAIFDCDHVPTRSFLQMTMGWFLRDRKLGLLQTPHHFYSPDPFERNLKQFHTIPNEGELFYGIVQDGNDFWNAAFFCGFCGSCAVLRRSALAEIGGTATQTVTEDAHTSLRMQKNGWNTAWFGKNHNVPDWQSSQTGPFDLWPTGLGFEHFYGFIGGDTDQWHPALYDGTQPIQTPYHDPKYHMDADIADHAVAWIEQQHSLAPDKPFFAYYAPGLAHAPHHAPKEWIAKFKGQFDQGWDKVREETLARQIKLGVVPAGTKLTSRPDGIAAWDSLSADQKKVYAHMMEVYAACLSYCDYNIGRVIQSVADSGELDNTIVIYIQGDNGASAEGTLQGSTNEIGVAANGVPESLDYLMSVMDELGGPMHINHYPVGWAHAMDSPFQWTKQVASHFGGTRNGMVISWPKHMQKTDEVRSQFCSVIDIAPTILEVAGIKEPTMINGVKQKPIEGSSLVYTFGDAKAPTHHNTQYFEMFGNRGIYQDGWMATTTPLRVPWKLTGPSPSPDDFKWELYHIAEDFSQANNLAAQNPALVRDLSKRYAQWSDRVGVAPWDEVNPDKNK